MFTFLLWLLLLIVCWPLALLALVLYPIVWLLLFLSGLSASLSEECSNCWERSSHCPPDCCARAELLHDGY